MSRRATQGAALLLALVAFGPASCGRVSIPPPLEAVLVFRPATAPAPNVHLQSGRRSGDRLLEVLVIAEGLEAEGVYGVSYQFLHPPDLFRFEGFREGEFFSREGADTRLSVTETAPGVLTVEHTRVGNVGPVPGTISATVMHSLDLTAISSGSGSFSFLDPQAFDENGAEVPGVTWAGGTVETFLD